MNLYYCKMPEGNVGDDVNEYIWPRYIKDLDDDTDDLLVGIGSLLNHHLPKAKKYTVISSGIGYGKLPKITDSWKFLAVRGEYSKEAFGLSDEVVLLDGAYLLKDCYERPNVKITHEFGYIPHVASLNYGDWEKVCKLAGVQFVDPRLSLGEFLESLCSCKRVLTEAMHGAIIADCYGVPWKPVKAYHHINTNKWDDWLSAFGKTARFSRISPVWYDLEIPQGRRLKNNIKKIIFSIYPKFNLTPPIYPASDDYAYKKVAGELRALTEGEFFLNDESQIDEKIGLLKKKIDDHFVENLNTTVVNPKRR